MRQGRQRGVTLIELMMSLAVIVIGLLVIFRVLASSVQGSSTTSHVAQAQARAVAIVEAIRNAPTGALTCLRNTSPANGGWTACETTCMTLQTSGAGASASSCIFTPGSFQNVKGPLTGFQTGTAVNNEAFDRLGQSYLLNTGTPPTVLGSPAQMGITYVRQVGEGLRTYEIVISVGWNDDNNATRMPADHVVTMATGLFQ